MIEPAVKNQVDQILISVLGLDAAELKPEAHFQLDFNASPADLQQLQTEIETALDIALPDFRDTPPATLAELYLLVADSSL